MLGRQMPFLSKINTKNVFGLTRTVDFVAWPPKTQPKSPRMAEGQPEGPLVQGNLASQLKINSKRSFFLTRTVDLCGLATQNTAKIAQDWLKANLKDHWSEEIWPPSSKECNPLDYFSGAKMRERLINSLITPWPPSRP
jgi:hypothetical protein